MPRGIASERDKSATRKVVSDGAGVASSHRPGMPDLVGTSELFSDLLDTLKSIACRHCCVMITGETGTGKEMVARKIHHSSQRFDKPFVPVDCTTLTGQLFESQLFGHVKGAFTGAIGDTLGFFRAADGGTIFLDEISEIPLDLQAKLLRVLQEGTVTPVGSTQSHAIDVRILCAANRDLKEMVTNNEFRADLYYRVNVVNLEIPPLRQRAEDIERAFVLSVEEVIEPSSLPKEVLMAAYTGGANGPLPTLDDAKGKLVADALRVTGGRKIAAAKILGIDRRRLNRLIEKLNVTIPKAGK